jgi:hypothetical protein
MVHQVSNSSTTHQGEDHQSSPGMMFSRIRNEFKELGLLGRNLMLEHEGIRYRILCDEKSFMVYRVNDNGGPRHHVPGWPVCLVNSDLIFEECGSQHLGNDHCACGLDIDTWLELVSRHDNTGE